MANKLMADEKVAALVEREAAKAVKEDRRRILNGLKELKEKYQEAEPKIRRAHNQTITAANKIVRDKV